MANIFQKTLFGLYYPYTGCLNRIVPRITLDGRRLQILPGVYKPLDAEHRMVDWIEAGKTVLDVGCGSGVISLFAAFKSKHVTAVDISPQAVENTQLNCREHGAGNVTVLQSDMFSAVEGTFDYIVSYPPLFKLSFASQDQQWCTSTTFVDELFRNARKYLAVDGQLVVMLPKEFNPSPRELAEQNGLQLIASHPAAGRSWGTRLHGLPYLHFNMDNQVFIFAAN